MVSYETLAGILNKNAVIEAKLDAALSLKGDVDALARRVSDLENNQAYRKGAVSTKTRLWSFVAGAVSTAVAAGALQYLPTIWHAVRAATN